VGQLGEQLVDEVGHHDRRFAVARLEALLLLVNDRQLVVECPG